MTSKRMPSNNADEIIRLEQSDNTSSTANTASASVEDFLPPAEVIDNYSRVHRTRAYTAGNYGEVNLEITLDGKRKNDETLKQLVLGAGWNIYGIKKSSWSDKTTYKGKLLGVPNDENNTYELSIKTKGIEYVKTRLELNIDYNLSRGTETEKLIRVLKDYVTEWNKKPGDS